MRIIRTLLSVALFASGVLGVQILQDDKWLWSSAPSHAYGLIAFALMDLVLAGVALFRTRPAMVGAALLAITQFGAMLADLTAGQPGGGPSVAFRNYLLNDMSYVDLLLIQIGILVVAIGALATPIIHRHVHWRPHLPAYRR